MEVGKSKGLYAFLRVVTFMDHLKGVLTQIHRSNKWGLLISKTNLLLKGLCLRYDHPSGPAQVGIYDRIMLQDYFPQKLPLKKKNPHTDFFFLPEIVIGHKEENYSPKGVFFLSCVMP